MYRASAEFHRAVFEPSPETRMLLKFGDTLIENEDIHLDSGVTITEPINPANELTIGACPAARLEAGIANFHGLLSGFEFGECEASLGVRIGTGNIAPTAANVRTIMRFDTDDGIMLEGFSSEPYLKVNGEATTAQPPMAIYSIYTTGNMVYCIGIDGEVWVATWIDGRTWDYLSPEIWSAQEIKIWDDIQGVLIPATDIERWNDQEFRTWDGMETLTWDSFVDLPDFNPFMRRKHTMWAQERRGISVNDNILYEFKQDGGYEKYEFVKLGTFLVNTPKKRRQNFISIDSPDRMTRFEVDASPFLNSVVYPITIGNYYLKLCAFVGVPSATLSSINSNRVLTQAPIRGEGITAREILSWVAAAAGSIARMTRDGEVELAWFSQQNITIDMGRWFKADIAEYAVAPIDKLQVRSSRTDIGVIVGNGTNAYQLVDNPFLYGASDAEIRTLAVPIYNRLTAFPAFSPIIANALCDWSVQAGDIIALEFNGEVYRLPIYSQVITWRKSIRAAYISTGEERRPELTAENRRVFQQNRAMHEFELTVDGISSRLTGAEGDLAELTYTVDQFSVQFVSKDGVISAINLSPEAAKIQAANISLEGLVTANSYFKINLDGSFETIRGKIGGWNIGATSLNSGSGASYVALNSSGTYAIQVGGTTTVPAFSVTPAGRVVGASGNIGGFELSPNGFGSSAMAMTTDGQVQFKDIAVIRGVSNPAGNYALFESQRRLVLKGQSVYLSDSSDNALLAAGTSGIEIGINQTLTLGKVYAGGGTTLGMSSDGMVVQQSSSRRYKENIRRLTRDDYDFDAFDPVIFNYIGDKARKDIGGLIAEDAIHVAEFVINKRIYGDVEMIESVDYNSALAIMLLEIKELRPLVNEFDRLRDRVIALEAQ